MQGLINEYRQSLREFKKSRVDTYKAGMIGDTQFAIEYMETGRMPGAKWTVARKMRAEREIPFDPNVISYLYESNQPVPEFSDGKYEQVEELLYCLSDREKDVYKMIYGEMFSQEQVAKILGLSRNSVKGYLRRAVKKIASIRNS